MNRCVDVGDGYLAEVQTPSKCYTGNVWSFFSGHYMHYGLNVQVFVDSHWHFSTYAVSGHGLMDDQSTLDATGAFTQILLDIMLSVMLHMWHLIVYCQFFMVQTMRNR